MRSSVSIRLLTLQCAPLSSSSSSSVAAAASRSALRATQNQLKSEHQKQQQQRRLLFSRGRRFLSGSPSIMVGFGSQTGTAQGFAQQSVGILEGKGLPASLVDLQNFDPATWKSQNNITLLVLACYGKGEPTDNAKAFHDWVMSPDRTPGCLDGIPFAVFGLGSRKAFPERFNAVGERLDKRIAELGGKRLSPLAKGDDSGDVEQDFDDWQNSIIGIVEQEFKSRGSSGGGGAGGEATPAATAATPAATATATPAAEATAAKAAPDVTVNTDAAPSSDSCSVGSPGSAPSSVWRIIPSLSAFSTSTSAAAPRKTALISGAPKGHPFFVPTITEYSLFATENVTHKADRFTQKLALDTPASVKAGLPAQQHYESGDHIGIYPCNRPQVVENLFYRLKVTSDEATCSPVQFFPKENVRISAPLPFGSTITTLKEVFSRFVNLMGLPSPAVIRTFAELASCPGDAMSLNNLAQRNRYNEEVKAEGLTVVDILEQHRSVNITPEHLVQILPRMTPRFYSISSSSKVFPDQVHITVRQLTYETPKNHFIRHGVATHYLRHLEPPAPLLGYIRTSDFKLPADDSTPVVMLAGGVGIAPFIGFLQEREWKYLNGAKLGPAVLFYGMRSPAEFAYRNEVDRWIKMGIVTVFPCYDLGDRDNANSSSAAPRLAPDMMRFHAKDIWPMFKNGGYGYVCGGTGGFAYSAHSAFKSIAADAGVMSQEMSEQFWMTEVEGNNRYREDLAG